MQKNKPIWYNYMMNTILMISSILFPLISFPYVSRVLLPEGIGRVTFALSIVSYFSMIAQLGIPTYGIRECAKLRDDKEELSRFVKELLSINCITCLLTYVLFFICLLSIKRLREDRILMLIMSCSILFNAVGLEWLYKGVEEYAFITKRSILFKFISFIGMFLLIRTKDDVLLYGALSIFASVGSNICNWIYAKRFVSLKKIKMRSIRRHVKPITLFFLLSVASTIYTNLDSAMLGFISSNYEVGLYASATKIKAALVSIVTSLGVVLLPRASYYIKKDDEQSFKEISQKALSYTALLALPLVAFFTLVSNHCIIVLSGEEYIGAERTMVTLMPTIALIGFSNIIGMQILVPLGKEKIVFVSVLCGAIIDFTINYLLIPSYGSLGAGIGTVIAEAMVLIIQIIGYKKSIDLFRSVQWWKYILASIVAIIASYPSLLMPLNDLSKMIVSCILFFVSYFIMLVLIKDKIILEVKEKAFFKLDKIVTKFKSH